MVLLLLFMNFGLADTFAQNFKTIDTLNISGYHSKSKSYYEQTAHLNNDTLPDYCILLRDFETQDDILLGKVLVFYGEENKHSLIPSVEIEGLYPLYQPSGGLNDMATGDLNNDGLDEIVFGSINTGISQLNRGYIAICFSDGHFFDTSNIVRIQGKSSYGSYGCTFFISDINGDRIDDLIVGARFDYFFEGQIFIYFGGNDFDTIADKILYYPGSYSFHLQHICDLNADGINDIIARDNVNWRLDRFRLHIFFGGGKISDKPDYSLIIPDFSSSVIQDINNDGVSDIILHSDISQNLYKIYYGNRHFNFKNPVDTVISSFHSISRSANNFVIKFTAD